MIQINVSCDGSVETVSPGLFNVRHLGAVGDGVADDTQPVAEAVAAAAVFGAGVVYFPPGVYYLGDPEVTFPVKGDGLTLKGESGQASVIKCNEKRNTGLSLQGNDIRVDGLGFTGGNLTTTVLIEFGKTTRARNQIVNCSFTAGVNNRGRAIMVSGGGKEGTLIEGNTFVGCWWAVALAHENYFTTVRNNTIIDYGYAGIRAIGGADKQQHSSYLLIEGNRIYNPREADGPATVGYPIHTEGGGGQHRYVTVKNNLIRGTDKEWKLDTGTPDQLSFNHVDGLIVEGNVSTHGGDMGITLEPTVSNFTVVGNVCKFNDVAGIWCNAHDGVIANNLLVSNGLDRSNDVGDSSEVGVVLKESAYSVVVAGNRCWDDQEAKTQKYGLSINAGVMGETVGVNNFTGNALGEVLDPRGGT